MLTRSIAIALSMTLAAPALTATSPAMAQSSRKLLPAQAPKEGEQKRSEEHAAPKGSTPREVKSRQTTPKLTEAKREAPEQVNAHRADHGRDWHRRGGTVPKAYRGHVVSDWQKHGLRRPDERHRWVKVDGDYLLIATKSGLVAAIVAAAR
ncbi:regulator RcnB of Ni and Co efflux [Fulvimarina manganoxydans]|uniref:Regulator RcnB of Ni and Co efflux n=1 Tax=Fulvimarina manganoxydans TaxID=937218 RepID=A0A1W2E5F1_9HYPH|nr:RcnB family protein [Fulvimarina manganoxydans]SMD05013.1 regulator RcnB of Ni and Co efflux [Fulvimarina manganoxydans]